ncbi:MAG: type II toxin-antitoxin system RelE/ParE family toxin [Halioglobus sp.]|nr:type II toxin-antitoxin system RelE/ParE family toxin [Halioglobus sp.]
MRIFKNKAFSKWAAREGLEDKALHAAVDEIQRGLVDADLGGHVMKKRVALGGRGKSSGVRTLLVYQMGYKAFFVYGFAKSARGNISADELRALKYLAKELLGYSDKVLKQAIEYGELIEVENDG